VTKSDRVGLDEISGLYQSVLGRPLDEEARAYYASLPSSAIERSEVLRILVESPEFAARPDKAREAARRRHPELAEIESQGGIHWFHSMEFPDGSRIAGIKPLQTLRAEADAIFRHGVSGKSVLDIGAWDGFFSFEAERRGAARVLSTDWYCWGGPGWGSKAGYDYAHRQYKSKCETEEVDLLDLDPVRHGTFDVVLFLGVLYHLKDPLGGLEKAAAMSRERIVVETATSLNHLRTPAMRFLPSRSLNADATNFFAPNVACIVAMLEDAGFTRFEAVRNPSIPALNGTLAAMRGGHSRHIVVAWR
jgi:tRNA (mo5U34)-methyltransferase